MQTVTSHHDYPLIIVGAGMVGAACALLLARAGIKLALIEQREPPDYTPDQDYTLRVSAINHASQQLLLQLGVWPHIAAQRVSAYREMHVWDAAGDASIHFNSAEIQQQTLGYIVENDLIVNALLHALRALPNVDWYCPTSIESFSYQTDAVRLRLSSGKILSSQVLLGADGANSRVRQFAQLPVETWDYQQQAIVAAVRCEHAHRATAWQRFLPDGPLALLPLADGRCSIVWSTAESRANALLQLSTSDFCAELGTAFDYRLGKILDCGERSAYPLKYLYAQDYVTRRVALLGDAVHSIHPLAGQGVNLGFADAAQLAAVLITAQQQQRDLGSIKHLRRYARARQWQNRSMALGLDLMKRLFATQNTSVVALRNIGLRWVDTNPVLKHWFMQQARGETLTPGTAQNTLW